MIQDGKDPSDEKTEEHHESEVGDILNPNGLITASSDGLDSPGLDEK